MYRLQAPCSFAGERKGRVKVYSALYSMFNPLNRFFPEAECVKVVAGSKLEAPGILVIHGGSDIHPSIYGRPNEASYVGNSPSPRDQAEMKLFLDAVKAGVPILGICRGAQLACAMAGGILVQDVDGHQGAHRIVTDDGRTLLSNSIHHQMMYPWQVEHKLLGWSAIPKSTLYRGISDDELAAWPKKTYESESGPSDGYVEPEVVYFPQFRCLAVQGHPEMLDAKCEFNRYVQELINVHCLSS